MVRERGSRLAAGRLREGGKGKGACFGTSFHLFRLLSFRTLEWGGDVVRTAINVYLGAKTRHCVPTAAGGYRDRVTELGGEEKRKVASRAVEENGLTHAGGEGHKCVSITRYIASFLTLRPSMCAMSSQGTHLGAVPRHGRKKNGGRRRRQNEALFYARQKSAFLGARGSYVIEWIVLYRT